MLALALFFSIITLTSRLCLFATVCFELSKFLGSSPTHPSSHKKQQQVNKT